MYAYEFRDQRFRPIDDPLSDMDLDTQPDGKPWPKSWGWLQCAADYLGYNLSHGTKWADKSDLCVVLVARGDSPTKAGKRLADRFRYLVYVTHVYPMDERDECLIGVTTPSDLFDLMARLKPTIDFCRRAS